MINTVSGSHVALCFKCIYTFKKFSRYTHNRHTKPYIKPVHSVFPNEQGGGGGGGGGALVPSSPHPKPAPARFIANRLTELENFQVN